MGLSEKWIAKVGKKDPRHQLLIVKRAFGKPQLLEGDVLLTLNGELVTRGSDINAMYWSEALDVVILRNGNELDLTVSTVPTTRRPPTLYALPAWSLQSHTWRSGNR